MTTRQAPTKKPSVKETTVKSASVRNSSAKVAPRRKSASTATLAEQEADSPILPVDQLERLHAIKPDAVDWVIQQTQIEAEHRREETSRINGFILFEHLFGQVAALLIGVAGILGGSWAAINGQPWAGATIAVAVIAGLTVVFVTGRTGRQ